MAITTWPLFIRQCLHKRTNDDEFQELASLLGTRSPANGATVIQALLECRDRFCVAGDPLIPVYLRAVILKRLASPSDLLAVLAQRWNNAQSATPGSSEDAPFVNLMSELISSSKMVMALGEARKSLVLAARWLSAVAQCTSQDANRLDVAKIMSMIEAIGILLATVMGTDVGNSVLTKPVSPRVSSAVRSEPRTSVQKSLDICLPILSSVSAQLFHRLDAFQKHFDLFDDPSAIRHEADAASKMNMDVITFEAGVLDLHVAPSRAAMMIYIDAKLRTSTTADDSSLLNFLNTRHSGNHENMFLELVIAGFQVLTNWITRSETEQALSKAHQFLINKVPSLLTLISGSSFGSFSPETCLVAAMRQVDEIVPASAKSTCSHFIRVCVLHQLVSSTTVDTMTPDLPKGPELQGLYQKDELVSQMRGSPQKVGRLVEEISRLEGNSGVIAQALVEVINAHCLGKETAALKDISHKITRHPEAVETIALFVRPRFVLSPLCSLLDAWKWDDLHGESQPVYDEFGSILLLVQSFKRRLGLPVSELGVVRTSSFIARFFEHKNSEMNLDDLTDETQKHLGEWINALFIAEGLNDELTSSCSPQEFYLLIPTLLNQSMLAHECGKLSWDTLKSGFEYLLESFLLPSLVPALLWLSRHAQRHHSPKLIAKVLQVLMKSPENSEAKEMHHAVLHMTAESLRMFLAAAVPKVAEAQILLGTLAPFDRFTVKMKASDADIRLWGAGTQGVLSSLGLLVQSLVLMIPGNQTPAFTYAQVEHAKDLCGTQLVLKCFMQELHRLAGSQQYGMALDIITALICSGHHSALRDGLRLDYRRLGDLLKQDPGLAEEAVRLHRRAESLVVLSQEQELSLGTNIAELDMQNIATTSEQHIDMAAMATTQDQPQDIDEVLDAAAAMGQLEDTSMGDNVDDVFGNPDDDMLMNFDELDMDGMF